MSFLFATENKNIYFYSPKKKQFILCHPILAFFIMAFQKKEDLEQIKQKMECELKEKLAIERYYSKFKLFQENGYFDDSFHDCKKSAEVLSPEIVRNCLIDTMQVTFEVTESCNLACYYCAFGGFYKNNRLGYKGREISLRKVENLMRYLQALWAEKAFSGNELAVGFYGGEPLLRMDIVKKIVNLIKQMKLNRERVVFSMTTNGVLLHKHIEYLIENDFKLLISLDGDRKNNEYRVYPDGKPVYDDITHNVRMIQQRNPEFFLKNISFNAVLHNKNTVRSIFEYFQNEFQKIPSIAEVSSVGINAQLIEEFNNTYRNLSESYKKDENSDELEKALFVKLGPIKNMISTLARFSGYNFSDYNHFLFGEDSLHFKPTGTCYPFFRKVFLSAKGLILPCERIDHQFAMGEVTENDVIIDFDKIADDYNKRLNRINELCSVCGRMLSCQTCMYHVEIEKNKIDCPGKIDKSNTPSEIVQAMSELEKKPGLYQRILDDYLEK